MKYNIKPGTWVEVRWNDAPNSMALLVDKVRCKKKDAQATSFIAFYPDSGSCHTRATVSQITAIYRAPLNVPVTEHHQTAGILVAAEAQLAKYIEQESHHRGCLEQLKQGKRDTRQQIRLLKKQLSK